MVCPPLQPVHELSPAIQWQNPVSRLNWKTRSIGRLQMDGVNKIKPDTACPSPPASRLDSGLRCFLSLFSLLFLLSTFHSFTTSPPGFHLTHTHSGSFHCIVFLYSSRAPTTIRQLIHNKRLPSIPRTSISKLIPHAYSHPYLPSLRPPGSSLEAAIPISIIPIPEYTDPNLSASMLSL